MGNKSLTYQQWSWAKCRHSPQIIDFLKSIQGKYISEEDYIQTYKMLKGRNRKPSTLKREYRQLKEKFGFFGLQNKTGN